VDGALGRARPLRSGVVARAGYPGPYPERVMATSVDDQRRVAAITAYDAVRVPPRAELQGIVELAALLSDVPKATVNVVTEDKQHQIAAVGFEPSVCRREDSMCTVTLGEGRAVRVRDASQDPRFAANPFVTGQIARVRFYASFPLVSREGVPFGTLCVFDEQPRELSDAQAAGLATLADRVVDVFELRLRNRELALSLMEIQAVQAELERSNERLASFAGQVSHDLKTPLTTLSLSLTLIREQMVSGELGPEGVRLLDRAINGSARMADLIDDVLDYARLGGTLKATEVDLDFVLGEVLDDLEADLVGVTLHIDRLPVVNGDRAQLRAVLQNLVSNAAKYRTEDRAPEVTISARHVQRAWRIEVTDNGRGVPAAERNRVFEPLARADSDGGVEGSGIGLSTCRRIIGAHGGRIGLDPTVTLGARFWFELPD
jgi:signal transduction histidine kinase